MKIRSMVAFAGTLFITGSLAQAASTDITIFDGLGGDGNYWGSSDPRLIPLAKEANEVESDSAMAPEWDLRAFGFEQTTTATKLAYQGGFNIGNQISTGISSNSNGDVRLNPDHFGIGSIFIDIEGNYPGTPPAVPEGGTTGPGQVVSNTSFQFEYAITLDYSALNGTIGYQIYKLASDSSFISSYYAQMRDGDPYLFMPTTKESLLFTGSTTVANYTSATSFDSSVGATNGAGDKLQSFNQSNYFAEFNLEVLRGFIQSGTTFRVTQECGNDVMVGQVVGTSLTSIPETGTTVGLMGLLAGSAFLRSRRRA